MDVPDKVKELIGDRDPESVAITVRYRNWRGEVGNRKIIPVDKPRFDSTEYHPEPQWLLEVWDLEKQAYRTYAWKEVLEWNFPAQ